MDFVSLHDSISLAVVNEVLVAPIHAREDLGTRQAPNVVLDVIFFEMILDVISEGGKMKKKEKFGN